MVDFQKKGSTGKKAESTQKYLSMAEVKGDTVIMKDGSLRSVVAVSSTNFALKSEDEQNALTGAYQNFLNALDFPIQILMHSRVLEIQDYLEKLRGLAAGQTNELLRIQMTEYIEYVARLVEYANIMSKNFYVVIPYTLGEPMKDTLMSKVKKIFNPAVNIAMKEEEFEKAGEKLEERVSQVMGGLGVMGLRTMKLNTEDLIELLYQSYNFETATPLHVDSLEELDLQK